MPYPTQWADFDPNKFMCCICFSILDVGQCSVDSNGDLTDTCIDCYNDEVWINEGGSVN